MSRKPTARRSLGRLLAIGLISIAAITATQAQSLSTASVTGSSSNGARTAKLPNIVLVHGAWGDASSWSKVIQRLQSAGYNVTSVQMVFSSLSDDAARTRRVLSLQNGPTLLVAHSFGGAIITRLGADAPNVVGLVYESAFAPDEGETLKALLNGGPQPAGAAAIRPDKDGILWLDPAGFLKYFSPDVDRTEASVMAAEQTPIAGSEFQSEEKFGAPAWKSFPTWYLITENDQMVPPAAQHFFAKRMNATTESVAGSHVSMVSHPDVVANFIIKAAQTVAK